MRLHSVTGSFYAYVRRAAELFPAFLTYLFQYVVGHTGPRFDDAVAVFDIFGIEAALVFALLRLGNHFLELDRLVVYVVDVRAVVRRIAGDFDRFKGQYFTAHIVGNLCRIHIDRRVFIVLPHIIFRCECRRRNCQGHSQSQYDFFCFHLYAPSFITVY